MKKYSFWAAVLTLILFGPTTSSAATLYSQSVNLMPGWNIVSTPRVLDSHSFSATENATNFDIYILDASKTAGWATMPQEGQTEFTPLTGYFVDNKTGANQTLTFNYLASTTPNQQLFSKTFSSPGWYSIGIANPTYALPVGTAASVNTGNPGKILNALSGLYDNAVDFTASLFSTKPDAVEVGNTWKMVVPSDINTLNDFRETKGYALNLTQANGTYDGFQNSGIPAPVIASFAADSLSIANGASTTLSWSVTGATTLSIDQGVGTVTGNSISVSPTTTTTYTLTATNNGGTATSAVTVHVSTVTLSVQNATSVVAQNVATNVSNQPLGGFQTNLTGEGVTVQSLAVHFNSSAAATLTSVSLVNENGATVAGPFDATVANATNQDVTFTGSIDFPVGTHTYTLKGKIANGTLNGVTIQASTNPSSDWTSVTGDTTGNNVTPTIGNFTMNTMTVQVAALTVSNGTTPTSGSTIVAGGQNVLLATVQLDASQSGEDVRLSSVPVAITTDSGGANSTTGTISYLSSCQIWNGTTALNTGSRVINAATITGATTAWATTFSFDNSLTIPKGTVMNLPITCNVSSSAPGTATYAIAPTTSIAPTGVTSGSTITISTIAGSAPVIHVSSGATLAGSTDSSSPSTVIVAGGTSGVLANVIKFRATDEAVNLQKVGLALPSTAVVPDITTAYLYAGNNIKTTAGVAVPANTLIGTVTFSAGSATATSTLSTSVQLPADQDATILVKADLAAIGTNKPGHEADTVAIDYDSARGVGANSGKTVDASGVGATSLGLRTFASYPIVAAGPAAPSSPNGVGQVLKKFSVAASTAGGIGLDSIAISIATSSGVTLTNVKLIANTNSDYTGTANVPGTTGGIFGAAFANVTSGSTNVFSQSGATHAPLEIGANSTIYFTLVGDVTVSGTATTWSINATVLGDATADSLKLPSALSPNSFIWSGNATSTASNTADYDWANGANVQGLSSTGF